jgi:hypothetical protein
MPNDGYHYRLVYTKWEAAGDEMHLVAHADDVYHDLDRDTLLGYARALRDEGCQVTLMRRAIVPQPPWEAVAI